MSPAEQIDALVKARATSSDASVLGELAAFAPLPDEASPAWADDATWARAYLFVALSDVCALRRLRRAVALLLERACYGDPGEMMRGLRHACEAIFDPDWADLAALCIERTASPRAGTRLWAMSQLAVLRDSAALPAIIVALRDPTGGSPNGLSVQGAAARALEMLCRQHSHLAPRAVAALRARADESPNGDYFAKLAGKLEAQ
jgi:hypothetical protein